VLEKMTHGRVFFMGDASAQHSPFGARGGNRAVQDANNLAWKLALVVQGKAAPALLETHGIERHFAARENVEIASRSAVFIAPETEGERLVRDAYLELARRHEWARPMVNVGRLSVASIYAHSPLNAEHGAFSSALAQPGAVAPGGRSTSIDRVLDCRVPASAREASSIQPPVDRLFDRLSAQLDGMPARERAAALTRVVAKIERARGNLDGIAGI
jgi:hypothetical protein